MKAEGKVAQLSSAVVKAESEVKMEREKMNYLVSDKEDLESAKTSTDYKVPI